MSEPPPPPPRPRWAPAVTVNSALANAARLLHQAELEVTNLPLMERLDELAASWINIATLLRQQEH